MLLSLKGFNDTLNKFWTVGGITKNIFFLKTIKLACSQYKIGWQSLTRDTLPFLVIHSMCYYINPAKRVLLLPFKSRALNIYHPDDSVWKTMAWEQLTESSWFHTIPLLLVPHLNVSHTVSKVILHDKSEHIPLFTPYFDSPFSMNKAWVLVPVHEAQCILICLPNKGNDYTLP